MVRAAAAAASAVTTFAAGRVELVVPRRPLLGFPDSCTLPARARARERRLRSRAAIARGPAAMLMLPASVWMDGLNVVKRGTERTPDTSSADDGVRRDTLSAIFAHTRKSEQSTICGRTQAPARAREGRLKKRCNPPVLALRKNIL